MYPCDAKGTISIHLRASDFASTSIVKHEEQLAGVLCVDEISALVQVHVKKIRAISDRLVWRVRYSR